MEDWSEKSRTEDHGQSDHTSFECMWFFLPGVEHAE